MSGALRVISPASITIMCVISAIMVSPLSGVLHGTPTAPFEFPELARIYRCNFLRCTATVLNHQWVMTSPFCFVDVQYRVFNLSEFFVNVGDHNSSVRESSEQNLSIVDIVVHKKYRRGKDYDIVLVRVQPDIKFGPTVRPVNMAGCEQSPQAGTKLTLVGFGEYMNFAHHQHSVVPRKGEITTLSFADCIKSLCEGQNCTYVTTRFVFCSSNEEGLVGPCNADPGAPAFFIKEDGTRILVGQGSAIVGGVEGQCEKTPFLYVDLAPFVGWIHRRISGCGNYPKNIPLNYDKPSPIPCPSS